MTKKYKHVGWAKYCYTSTSWPIEFLKVPLFVEPWPCQTVYYKDKPELSYSESKQQFKWKKIYARNH
jgi:hypothetical protein